MNFPIHPKIDNGRRQRQDPEVQKPSKMVLEIQILKVAQDESWKRERIQKTQIRMNLRCQAVFHIYIYIPNKENKVRAGNVKESKKVNES